MSVDCWAVSESPAERKMAASRAPWATSCPATSGPGPCEPAATGTPGPDSCLRITCHRVGLALAAHVLPSTVIRSEPILQVRDSLFKLPRVRWA